MYNNFKRTEILYYEEGKFLLKDINIFKLISYNFVIRPSNEKFNSSFKYCDFNKTFSIQFANELQSFISLAQTVFLKKNNTNIFRVADFFLAKLIVNSYLFLHSLFDKTTLEIVFHHSTLLFVA